MNKESSELFLGRGLAFWPHVDPQGGMAWSAGRDNIEQAIRIILLTDPGERLMLPDFGAGLGLFVHQPNTIDTRRAIAEQIRTALERWEPRIKLESLDVQAAPGEPTRAIASLVYRVVAFDEAHELSLVLSLGGGGA